MDQVEDSQNRIFKGSVVTLNFLCDLIFFGGFILISHQTRGTPADPDLDPPGVG